MLCAVVFVWYIRVISAFQAYTVFSTAYLPSAWAGGCYGRSSDDDVLTNDVNATSAVKIQCTGRKFVVFFIVNHKY